MTSKPTHRRNHHRTSRAGIWLPDQPGAWVMALVPAIGGMIVGGISWRNLWLLVTWGLCYCFQFSMARWLAVRSHEGQSVHASGNANNANTESSKPLQTSPASGTNHADSRSNASKPIRSNTYFLPAATYGVIAALAGLPMLFFAQELLWWIPLYATLAALSFLAAWLRDERSLWGNAVAVCAAGTVSLITTSLGSKFFFPVTPGQGIASASLPVSCTQICTSAYYFGSSLLPKTGVVATLAFIFTEYASVLFVKTMIRQHGNTRYYALSVLYHLVLTALSFTSPMMAVNLSGLTLRHGTSSSALLWGFACIVLLSRAVVLPLRAKRMKPIHIGMVEAVTSMMNLLAITVVLA